ncbi:hypothetical protein M3Y96_00890000 [Aphelenchoides besseyi]|nr:hypothetical protein M3Y96_00890000 [Aphelenchoides besseyi]
MTVSDCLNKVSARDNLEKVIDQLELRHLLDRQPDQLSGSELQRFGIATTSSNYVMVVEHDLAIEPQSLLDGMNRFLEILNISFRRDDESHRPRINKLDSVKDTEQKRSGNYFFLDTA